MATGWVNMGTDELVAEDRGRGGRVGCHRSGPCVRVLHRPGIYLAGSGCWEMGEFEDGVFRPLAVRFLCVVPAVGGVVDVWNNVGVYIWGLEGVSGTIRMVTVLDR